MIFSTWNICTLLDNQDIEWAERTAITSRESVWYTIDAAALGDTRQVDEGHLREEDGGYTFWNRELAQDRYIHSISFAI